MTIEKTGGPAPRGLPQVSVEVTDDGYIRGIWPETQTITQEGQEIQVAQEQLGGKTYTGAWYQYCGVESQENIEPDYEAEDNLFRAAPGKYDWMDEVYDEGERIHIDDFDDYDEWGNGIGDDGVGKPASVTWRSQNAETALNVNVIRSSRIEEAVENSGDEWLEASTDQGFVAYLNVCTHFCCIPDYKVLEESARYDAANGVYCVCHQSVYNPFTLEEALFIARPRPDE